MRVACLGDLHLRNTVPKSRKPSYIEEMWKKIRFISYYCEEHGVSNILAPGDLFHTPKQPLELMIPLAQLIRETSKFVTRINWHCILGQHDLFYHQKDSPYTSVNLLAKAGLVDIVDEKPVFLGEDVWLYGCSYDDEIQEITTNGFNILMIHAMIIKDKKLWEQQDKFLYSQHLLKQYKFDLIVSGDNHSFFQDHYRSRHLVNCGSLMRTNSDQKNHKPCFFIYDTNDKSLTKILIPITDDVFISEQKQPAKDDFNDLFSATLKDNSEDVTINFRKNVEILLDKAEVDSETKQLIKEIVYD